MLTWANLFYHCFPLPCTCSTYPPPGSWADILGSKIMHSFCSYFAHTAVGSIHSKGSWPRTDTLPSLPPLFKLPCTIVDMLLSIVNISNCTHPGKLFQESRNQLCWHLWQWPAQRNASSGTCDTGTVTGGGRTLGWQKPLYRKCLKCFLN